MNALLINASPKRILSNSQYFLGILKCQLVGCRTTEIKLSGPNVYQEIFSHFSHIDTLVIALPVYVDGVPSHVLRFLKEAETYCRAHGCHFKLYVISNCGFFEGKQCKHELAIMQSFCAAAGLTWGAGVGVGAGEMLGALRLTPLFEVTKFLLSLPFFLLQEGIAAGLANYNWISTLVSMLIFVLFNIGLYSSLWKMQRTIRRGASRPDWYTSVTLCPRFLFTMFANGYWILRAALHGTGVWQLYKKK